MSEELLALQARVTVLEQENIGLTAAIAALAMSLCRVDAEADRRTRTLLALTMVERNVFEDEPCGFPIRSILDTLHATTQEGLDPEHVKVAGLLLAASAGPDRRPALKQWLAQASVDEIGEDMLETLRRIATPDELPGSNGGSG